MVKTMLKNNEMSSIRRINILKVFMITSILILTPIGIVVMATIGICIFQNDILLIPFFSILPTRDSLSRKIEKYQWFGVSYPQVGVKNEG